MSANQLHVNAAELLREPGLHRHIEVIVAPRSIDAEHEAIDGDVSADLELVSTLAYYVVHRPECAALPKVAGFRDWLVSEAARCDQRA